MIVNFIVTLALPLTLTAQTAAVPTTQRLEAELKANPRALRTRGQLARLYANEKKFTKTVDLLNAYTDQLDDDTFLLLAGAYSAQEDYANEVRILNILSAKAEDNYRWHMLLAQAYLKQAAQPFNVEHNKDMVTSSIQHLRRCLALEHKFKPAYDLLLNTLLGLKANNEARELLAEGVTRFGERPELLREQCRLDAVDGYLVQAVNNCRHSIEVSPTYADSYVYLVQVLHDQGEDNQAEKDIVMAAARFRNSEFVQWAAGTVFYRKKNYSVAARYFKAGVAADPKPARSQIGAAQSLFDAGQEAEALPYFISACKRDSSTNESFLASGSKLKQHGKAALGGKYIHEANDCH